MGKDNIDIEKLKQEKKAKKLEKKRLSQQKAQEKQQKQLPPPKPLVRSFHAIPNRKQLSKTPLGTFSIMSFNVNVINIFIFIFHKFKFFVVVYQTTLYFY